ncbi:hypothetical protein NECAME_12943 [Necator americanus]|uniref:Uncharacterized protein n=1 Tax=Necator americanus TaxID=51031 RepID=W2SXJ3_NECAM|nr:hypothetical protein NECAME_12943 [Necator americanus]ETN74479.1 hypothetical protein NECAME_12943 [Necator americanus]
MCENDDDDGGGGGGGVDDVDGRRAASRLSGRRMVETGLRDRPLSVVNAVMYRMGPLVDQNNG